MMRAIGLAMIVLGGLGLGMSFIDWRSTDDVDVQRPVVSETGPEPLADAVVDGRDDAGREDVAESGEPTVVAVEPDQQRPDDDEAAANIAYEAERKGETATIRVSEQDPANVQVFDAQINDDKVEPTLWADIAAASEVVGEDSGYANFLLTLSEPAERSVVIIFSTVNLSAKDEEDYRSQRGTVTFQPGVVAAEIHTPLVNDDVKEDDEQFAIVLNGAPNTVSFRSRRAAVVIKDDD